MVDVSEATEKFFDESSNPVMVRKDSVSWIALFQPFISLQVA